MSQYVCKDKNRNPKVRINEEGVEVPVVVEIHSGGSKMGLPEDDEKCRPW